MKVTAEPTMRFIAHLTCDRCGASRQHTIGYDFVGPGTAMESVSKDYWCGWHFWEGMTICATCLVKKMRPLVLLNKKERPSWKEMRDRTLVVIKEELDGKVLPIEKGA